VDILKVDFLQTSPADQEKLARRYQKLKIGMAAEKVETEPEFRRALQLGYDYFQGYFFAHPTVLQLARVPVSQMRALRLMKQIQKEELDFPAIEELIRQDVSLSHSLLTYVNSGAFQWAERVRSIRRALVLLGTGEIRKWGWMASLSSLGGRRPAVLIAQVLMRGRFCEAIACSAKLPLGECDAFLLGMLSLLDALLERPLQGIHDDLNIGRNIQSALLETAGEVDPLSLLLRIVKSYEVGDWDEVEAAARVIGVSADDLSTCYLESLTWVDAVSSSDYQKRRTARSPVPIDFQRNPEIRHVTQY
jgi:EAL and modified HD-GYP domain-containing signal transduction protein